jgi:3D (Asp-Asp-Asp) domain-containing protein
LISFYFSQCNRALFLILSCIFLASCATSTSTNVDNFDLAKPYLGPFYSPQDPVSVKVTFYHRPRFESRSTGYSLLDMKDIPNVINGVPVRLSKSEWCNAALEGSVAIIADSGKVQTFNYAGLGDAQLDCTDILGQSFRASSRVRFAPTDNAWGDGVDGCALVPYRTIAVDKRFIARGSVVYIPIARGVPFEVGDKRYVHDGYFIAADRGGAIKGAHIDMFVADGPKRDFVSEIYAKGKNVDAYIVGEKKVQALLKGKSKCS